MPADDGSLATVQEEQMRYGSNQQSSQDASRTMIRHCRTWAKLPCLPLSCTSEEKISTLCMRKVGNINWANRRIFPWHPLTSVANTTPFCFCHVILRSPKVCYQTGTFHTVVATRAHVRKPVIWPVKRVKVCFPRFVSFVHTAVDAYLVERHSVIDSTITDSAVSMYCANSWHDPSL